MSTINGFGPVTGALNRLQTMSKTNDDARQRHGSTLQDTTKKLNDIIVLAKDTETSDADFPAQLRSLLSDMSEVPSPNPPDST